MEKLIKRLRRELHQIPELDFDLYKTNEYILNFLKDLNFEIFETAKTGVLAFKKGLKNETIAFRADMDALPIKETNDITFKSKNEGLMHACGHDAHMSMLLTFAKKISDKELLNESILLIFQPAEETKGGAKVIVDEGVLERFNVTKIFGLHVFPNLDEGILGIKDGVMMASNALFDIEVFGKSAHGAMPEEGVDAIIAATMFINQIQLIISRKISSKEKAVISVGKINGGNAHNVIADYVSFGGTIRFFHDDVFKQIENEFEKIKKSVEISLGVKIKINLRKMYPVVKNNNEIFKHVKSLLKNNDYNELNPMMTSEDFSYYLEKVPGMFVMLGTKNISKGYIYPLHHSKFNLDEKVLLKGVEFYDLIAKSYNLY